MKASKAISSVSFAALLLIAWWLLAPPQLGGRTSYAVIYGISMNPRFKAGDLVLLRAQPSYHVGEIVGYHSQKLGKPVMHRIIKIDASGHYWFKGDNNNFIDPEHPLANQLFGKEWIRIPGVGTQLEKIHNPRNAAILAALAAFFVLGGGGVSARRRRRRRASPLPPVPHAPANLARPAGAAPAPPVSAASAPSKAVAPARTDAPDERAGNWPLAAAAGVAIIGLAGIAATTVLAIVAFTRPPATLVTESNLYVEHGRFDYTAAVPVGAVYDHSPLHAGDAIFSSVVRSFDVGFRYRMTSDAGRVALSGTSSLVGELSDGNGWTRKFQLAAPATFNGDSATVTGRVNVVDLQHAIASFQRATGIQNDAYQLTITPHVTAKGVVAGELVRDTFSPPLTFTWAQGRLRLGTGSDTGTSDSLAQERSGTGTVTTQRKVGALGVSDARRAALFGLPISIGLSLVGGFLFLFLRGNDEVALIRRRYGSWMIDVEPAARPPHLERRVESMDALARIAERYERLILHEQRGGLHSYLVEDDGRVYRYDARGKSMFRGERQHAAERAEPVGAGTGPAQED